MSDRASLPRMLLASRRFDWFVRETVGPDYLMGWVHLDVCRRLQAFSDAVARGESPRLALFLPPRTGKSTLASQRLPAWHLGRHPEHEVLVCGHTVGLVQLFSRRARDVVMSEAFRSMFPTFRLRYDRQAVVEWETKQGGGYRCSGIGGAITGHGANILIVDDPVKDHEAALSQGQRDVAWEWYRSVAYTRLAPGGGVLIVMTRWHEDDLAGRLLSEGGEQWVVVRYPAVAEEDEEHRKAGDPLHPERYDLDALERIHRQVGERAWLALYQQRPTSPGGSIWKREWFRRWESLPPTWDDMIQSWDLTFGGEGESASYVVGQVWGKSGADLYLLDQVRGRWDFPGQLAQIRKLTARWPEATAVVVEDKANGRAVIDVLSREIQGVVPFSPHGSKEVRASSVSPMIEAGNVWVPTHAQWADAYLDECSVFPSGQHDDQVDATSQALAKLNIRKRVFRMSVV